MSTLSLRDRIAAYDRDSQSTRVSPAEPIPALAVQDGPKLPLVPPSPAPDSPVQQSPDSYAPSTTVSTDDPIGCPVVDPPAACRPNEHLAILTPRHLWKADRAVTRCDKYACRAKFGLFERKHHCRKCGGIYCHACSSRTTPLLDTTHLPFLLPPRNTPIAIYQAPNAPILDARVCDDCYETIFGYPSRKAAHRVAASTPSSPRTRRHPALPPTHSEESASSLSPATPPDGRPVIPRSRSAITVIATHTPPDPHTGPSGSISPPAQHVQYDPYMPMAYPWTGYPTAPRVKTTRLQGDLDRYPLKDPSATCKAAGGGRWEPTPIPIRWDTRLPSGLIRYEVEAEKLEEEKRLRRANPVIIDADGDIRVRRHRPPPPPPRGGPYKLPTF